MYPQTSEKVQVNEMRFIGNCLLAGADAIEKVQRLEQELKELESKYHNLLVDSIHSAENVNGQLMQAILNCIITPGTIKTEPPHEWHP